MKVLSIFAVACICFASAVFAVDNVIETETETSSKTTTIMEAVVSKLTVSAVSTKTVVQVTQLPVSTYYEFTTAETPTITRTDRATVDVTVTELAGAVTDTSVVAGSGISMVTVTAGVQTVLVTVGGAATATVYATAAGTATLTTTITTGYVTVQSCLPTTTIVVSTTVAAPVPTSPAGTVVSYVKQSCSVVVCGTGTTVATTNSVVKSCTLTYYGTDLVSSTCLTEFCCAATTTSTASTNVVRNTNCRTAAVTCPTNSVMLTDTAGVAVPCLQTYVSGKLTTTTCDSAVCCSAVGATATATTTTTTTVASGSKSCKNLVKCKVYKKDTTTNYILKCSSAATASNCCTTAYCCQTV